MSDKWTRGCWLGVLLIAVLALGLLAAGCDDDDDDDDNDDAGDDDSGDDDAGDDDSGDGTDVSGTISYDGEAEGDRIGLAAFSAYPPQGPPLAFAYIDITGEEFPIDYLWEDVSFSGDVYLAAFLDVDPDDGVSLNPELDPADEPTETTTIVEGEDNVVDFTLVDPS